MAAPRKPRFNKIMTKGGVLDSGYTSNLDSTGYDTLTRRALGQEESPWMGLQREKMGTQGMMGRSNMDNNAGLAAAGMSVNPLLAGRQALYQGQDSSLGLMGQQNKGLLGAMGQQRQNQVGDMLNSMKGQAAMQQNDMANIQNSLKQNQAYNKYKLFKFDQKMKKKAAKATAKGIRKGGKKEKFLGIF